MIVKLLGFIDFIVAIIILCLIFGLTIPSVILWVAAIIMFVKGIFIFWGDIASGFDWLAGIILIVSIFYNVPVILLIIAGFLILQKGFFSIIA